MLTGYILERLYGTSYEDLLKKKRVAGKPSLIGGRKVADELS
jgi:hypothetical protein